MTLKEPSNFSYFIDMWIWFKNWIASLFKKEEVCAHCGRRLFDYERGKNKCYPMLTPEGKIENVHRECLYSYLFKKSPKECDYIYKCLTK